MIEGATKADRARVRKALLCLSLPLLRSDRLIHDILNIELLLRNLAVPKEAIGQCFFVVVLESTE